MAAKRLQYVAESRPEFPQRAKPVRGPEDIAALFRERVPEGEDREHFVGLYLNSRYVPLRSVILSIGSLNASIVHPREVLVPAVESHAAAFVLAHNHPSGDPTPSEEDIAITRRLVESGRMLGVELLDHVVIGAGGSYVSLRERRVIR